MNRKSFLKTALGSAAALALPPQVFGNQRVTPNAAAGVIGGFNPLSGIKSRFAFGGQFNFGEVTLYQHLSGVDMTVFFKNLQRNIWEADETQRIVYRCNHFDLNTIAKYCSRQEVSILIICDGVDDYEDIVKLTEIALKHPMVSVICSEMLNRSGGVLQKTPWLFDNVINFSVHKDGLTSHKCELIKNRRGISGPRVKYFSKAADGQFHNVGVTEQI